MPDNAIFETLKEKELLSLAVYGEARGESIEGKVAVASVITNRLARRGWYGKTLQEVILKPYQFSCFLENDPNHDLLVSIAMNYVEYLGTYDALRQAWWVALGFLDGWLASNVAGATNYFADYIPKPGWATDMEYITKIGRHSFYAA